jgi:hypothetical protein
MSFESMINAEVAANSGVLHQQFDGALPFRHVVIEDFFTGDFCRELIQTFPAFDEKLAINEDGQPGAKAVREKIRGIGPAWARLDELCRSDAFRGLVSDITGIADLQHDPWYFGGGTHENLEGQSLDAHVDFNYHPRTRQHRRLNLIVYLNPEWQDDWGGSLQLHRDPYLPPSQDDITVVTPLANRCVIFETNDHSWHGFRRIQLPEGKKDLSRRSFALYYYTDTRPEEETFPEHSTIYVEEHLPEDWQPGMTLQADQLQHLKNLVASRDQHLRRLYLNISRLNQQVQELASEREPLSMERAEALDFATLEEARELAGDLLTQLQKAQGRINELEHSTSWKLTAPLRALKRMISGE